MDLNLTRDLLKWLFTFAVLGATLWWGHYCIETAVGFLQSPEVNSAEAVIGIFRGAIEGALIAWTGICVQFFFRKSPS